MKRNESDESRSVVHVNVSRDYRVAMRGCRLSRRVYTRTCTLCRIMEVEGERHARSSVRRVSRIEGGDTIAIWAAGWEQQSPVTFVRRLDGWVRCCNRPAGTGGLLARRCLLGPIVASADYVSVSKPALII